MVSGEGNKRINNHMSAIRPSGRASAARRHWVYTVVDPRRGPRKCQKGDTELKEKTTPDIPCGGLFTPARWASRAGFDRVNVRPPTHSARRPAPTRLPRPVVPAGEAAVQAEDRRGTRSRGRATIRGTNERQRQAR